MTPQPPSPGPDPQSALVARWLASEEAPQRAGLPRLDAAGTLALAWALKTACHQVWNSSPGQAVQAARWLALLADSAAAGPEVQALAQWTAGLAALVGGDMVQALQALEAASAGFDANAQPLFAAQAGVPQLIALSMLG
ncbi:MAG TPA: hypothetical protein VLA16_06610, partial [Ideonella sp.]|nr:hypothetical protein [Ideonella sp.]